jgi:hypothetical protein
MSKRVIYIPRTRTEAELRDRGNKPSLLVQAEKWRTRLNGKYEFSLVCYPEKFTGNPAEGGDDNTIYIYGGHGIAGFDGAGWPGNPDQTGSGVVTAKEVAERISDAGWSPSLFSGKVKVYSCYSGAPGNKEAFASLVAREMRSREWGNCSFHGYLIEIGQVHETITKMLAGALAGVMARYDTSLDEDKLTTDLVGQNHKWAVVDKQKVGRVSGQRVDF